MQYSPKLKKAMEEIKEILTRHDIAGIVVLHTPGHSEFLNRLDPGYSCCKLQGDSIRIKATLADHNGDNAARNRMISDTVNMLDALITGGGHILIPLMDIFDRVKELVEVMPGDSGFTSHNTQNN